MSDISTEIAEIQVASTGEEVRQSLVDGLNAVNASTLPEVSASDSGKFMMVNNSGQWVMGSGGLVPTPTGTKTITQNGTHDVTNYASANVDVQGGASAVIEPLSVIQNGVYSPQTGVDGFSPVTVNVDGGGGLMIPLIGIMNYEASADVSGTIKIINDGWISGFKDRYKYFVPLDVETGNVLDVKWNQPFEVFLVVKCSQFITRQQVLFGSYSGYSYAPTIEIGANGANIWCGFSTNGSSATNSLLFTHAFSTNTEITIKAVWDGTTYSVTVKEGSYEETKTVTPASAHYYNATNSRIEFGGINRSNDHNARYASMKLTDMYIKNNGTFIWKGAA